MNSSTIDQQFSTVVRVRKTPNFTSGDFPDVDDAIAITHPQRQNPRSSRSEICIPIATPLQQGDWLVIIHNSENSLEAHICGHFVYQPPSFQVSENLCQNVLDYG
jgi:hypothetical protein